MTLVVACNAVLQPCGEARTLPPRQRRLSTILKLHGVERQVVPLVFRSGVDWREVSREQVDAAARMRSQYRTTLVGPHDTVVFYQPVRGRNGAAIGLALAAIALLAIAGPAASAFAGGSALAAFAIQAGAPVGSDALHHFTGARP